MKNLYSFLFFKIFFFASLVIAQAQTPTKKTVCAVTINSNNEIELFKKNLSPQLWNFVELTDYKMQDDQEQDQWFKNACKKKISCDILVVSGHFGGTFFGESGVSLPLETLEKSTCNEDCSGIINQPKEVFLFGCNTLAGKEKDHRTPEQYLEVLLNDGFTLAQAQQVVAFRYSDLGASFKGRMAQVFTQTPRIYGFSSVGPSGLTVEPYLKKYLTLAKGDYQEFDKYNATLGSSINQKFKTSLSDSAVAQVAGLNVLAQQKIERPYCYLASEKVSVKAKLSYINDTLTQGRGLTIINYIKDFIGELKNIKHVFSQEETAILESLKHNEKVKADFDRILTLKGDVYLKTRVDSFTLMKDLQIINKEYYDQNIFKILGIDWQKSFQTNLIDSICSLDVQVDVDVNLISEQNKQSTNLYRLLACLRPQNKDVFELISSVALGKDSSYQLKNAGLDAFIMIKPQDIKYAQQVLEIFRSAQPTGTVHKASRTLKVLNFNTPEIINALVQTFEKSYRVELRNGALMTLAKLDSLSIENLQKVMHSFKYDNEKMVQNSAASVLRKMKSQDPQILQELIAVLKGTAHNSIVDLAARVLAETRPQDSEVIQQMLDIMKNSFSVKVRRALVESFGDMDAKNPNYISTLLQMAKNDGDSFARLKAIQMIGKIELKTSESIAILKQAAKSDTDEDVRRNASEILKKMGF